MKGAAACDRVNTSNWSKFDDNGHGATPIAVRPAVSGKPQIKFAFCTA
jgi:hypothetical protein